MAIALAEVADQPVEWPALGRVELGAVRLILVPDDDQFSRLARGRVPNWGVGLAFPRSRTIVLRADDGAVRQTLRHEMAHLALHQMVKGRVPLWFDEGYAGWAAGEFGRHLKEGGLKAALEWRDGPFRDFRGAYDSAPKDRPLAGSDSGSDGDAANQRRDPRSGYGRT